MHSYRQKTPIGAEYDEARGVFVLEDHPYFPATMTPTEFGDYFAPMDGRGQRALRGALEREQAERARPEAESELEPTH